ncbi:MAG: esterase-like activity of phytase family protein [Pseudomonadota bacterium]
MSRTVLASLGLGLALAWVGSVPPATASPEPIHVRTRTIERFDAGGDRFGRLEFRGGLVLTGPRGFGAISGLLTDGERFLAVSDTGDWLKGRMRLEGGRLKGLEDLVSARRLDRLGRPITNKRQGDAEGLTAVAGAILVMVESLRILLAYPADGLDVDFAATPREVAIPPAMATASRRQGVEGLATLPSGQVVAFVEGRINTGDQIPAWRLGGDTFTVVRNGPWSITGADTLPGGDVVIVERRYEGGLDVGVRVRRLGADALARGAGPFDGPVLLEAGFSAEIDNMEAIATDIVDGEIILTLMSDDNRSFWQRTLMLRFAVADPLPRRKPLPKG